MDSFGDGVAMRGTPPASPRREMSRFSTSPQSVIGSPPPITFHSPNRMQEGYESPHLRSPPQRMPSSTPEVGELVPYEAPRLVIRKLVLINYKSYAGRQEVGPFNENFTAVVGPNGGGKSNVIDSLLFVFGFRAKKMRQDKLTGLIHNSDKNPKLAFARVEVHFETLGEADSELVLAREIRRDGTTFYALNYRRCTYSEVAELLETRGIDLRHKRFLILQGEVESIALMPPKAEEEGADDGLLEYLEDIIGTSGYKVHIEELSTEAETLNVDCGEKQRRAEVISKDLRKLDAERAEVESYMQHKNRSTVARSSLYQLQMHKHRLALQSIEAELQEIQEALQTACDELAEHQKQRSVREKEIESKEAEANRVKADLKAATQKLKQAQLAQVRTKQKRDQLIARQRNAERNLSHAKHEEKDATIWLNNFEADNGQRHRRLAQVTQEEQEQRNVLEQIQAELHEATKDLHDELQQLQSEAEPWREQIAQLNLQLKAIETQRAVANREVEESQAKYNELHTQAKERSDEGNEVQRVLKAATKRFDSLTAEQDQVIGQLPAAHDAVTNTADEVNQLRQKLSQTRESRDSAQSQNRIEAALMRLKIPGLYGRLGSLGTIDQKYDIAVSTAGPDLNSFVVDTVEIAKVCLDMLRKNAIGQAKFIVMNKINPKVNLQSAHPNEFPAPRLLDLVKPADPFFIKAFASALGNTLVVDTPERANVVAFSSGRRNKVVTLEGVLVQSNGSMSGGGNPNRGYMSKTASSSISTVELEEMERKLASLEMELASARSNLTALESRKDELEREVPQSKIEMDKHRMTQEQVFAQFDVLRKQLKNMKQTLETLEENQETTLSTCHSNEKEIIEQRTSLEDRSRSIEDAIQGIQVKILEAGGLKLREQSSRVNDLQQKAQECQQAIEEGQQKLAQETSRQKKAVADISRYETELKECAEGGSSITEVANLSELESEVERLSATLQNCQNEVEDAKAESSDTREIVEKLRACELEAKNKSETMRKGKSDRLKRIADVEYAIKALSLYDLNTAKKMTIDSGAPTASPQEVAEEHEEEHANVKREKIVKDDSEDDDDECEDDGRGDGEDQISNMLVLPELSPDELDALKENILTAEIQKYDKQCEGKKFNLEVIERYKSRFMEYRERKAASDEALSKYETVRNECERTKKRRHNEFMTGFYQISSKLKEMYQLITMGGNAELELVDSMDPFAEGILFSVMPPKKSWRNIANLSGGEKTLSSLALVFALHHYKPTPLYVMDEIDAALDFRNVSIIANYIKERTKNGQFIVISLRNNMFELASRLIGVYKVENMTRSVAMQAVE